MENRLMIDIEDKRSKMKPKLGITHNEDERKKAILNAYPIYKRNSSTSAEARIDVQNKDHQWTRRYYKETTKNEPTALNIDLECYQYVQGLLWVLTYYYQGCVSWSWYYPYHHAPSIYDLHKFVSTSNKLKTLKFVKDKPYKPFEQLMIVLPPQSRHLLPPNVQSLMTNHSPLAHFYPEKYEFDPIFRRFYWECGPVLPPIDDDEIKSELSKKKLTPEEQKRNQNRGADIYIGSKVPT
jgi:5'-3' exonuclease